MDKRNNTPVRPVALLGGGIFTALTVSFLAGAIVGPTLFPPVGAESSKVESRCVKNEDEANLLGSQGWEVVTSAGAGGREFRYCLVRRQ